MKSRNWLLILPLICLAVVSCSPKKSVTMPPVPTPVSTPVPTEPGLPVAKPTQVFTASSVRPGSIAGHLSYPGDFIPELRIVAFAVGQTGQYYYVDTVQNQSVYQILNVPAGDYRIIAYLLDPTSEQSGGYSRAVPCGLLDTCKDHTLLVVSVASGQATRNIDPVDWYAPLGTYPPRPGP